jgi:hypothetical protein
MTSPAKYGLGFSDRDACCDELLASDSSAATVSATSLGIFRDHVPFIRKPATSINAIRQASPVCMGASEFRSTGAVGRHGFHQRLGARTPMVLDGYQCMGIYSDLPARPAWLSNVAPPDVDRLRVPSPAEPVRAGRCCYDTGVTLSCVPIAPSSIGVYFGCSSRCCNCGHHCMQRTDATESRK